MKQERPSPPGHLFRLRWPFIISREVFFQLEERFCIILRLQSLASCPPLSGCWKALHVCAFIWSISYTPGPQIAQGSSAPSSGTGLVCSGLDACSVAIANAKKVLEALVLLYLSVQGSAFCTYSKFIMFQASCRLRQWCLNNPHNMQRAQQDAHGSSDALT